jgi:enoyl-[acyl-carrier protein] reductase I
VRAAFSPSSKGKAPARSIVSIDDVGVAARLITSEALYVDDGYHIID